MLTNDCHERIEIADVDALLGDVDKILDHPHSIFLFQMLTKRKQITIDDRVGKNQAANILADYVRDLGCEKIKHVPV